MKRNLLLIHAFLTMGLVLSSYAGDQDFILVNETGLTIDQLFISPTTTQEWGEDVLGVDVLETDGSVEINFAHDTEDCFWDLLIIDEEGDKIVWTNIDLCTAAKITLYYKKGQPTADIENVEAEEAESQGGAQDFTLINQTGLIIDQLYVSPTTTKEWEEDILGVDTLADEASVDVKFSRDTEACNWDLLIVDEEGDKIVWSNIDLCNISQITLYYKDGQPTADLE